MRHILRRVRALLWRRAPSQPQVGGLTAVEYEALTLIAYEGGSAREQAEYCRQRGSEPGAQFWSQVAYEVRLRTRGRLPEKP